MLYPLFDDCIYACFTACSFLLVKFSIVFIHPSLLLLFFHLYIYFIFLLIYNYSSIICPSTFFFLVLFCHFNSIHSYLTPYFYFISRCSVNSFQFFTFSSFSSFLFAFQLHGTFSTTRLPTITITVVVVATDLNPFSAMRWKTAMHK